MKSSKTQTPDAALATSQEADAAAASAGAAYGALIKSCSGASELDKVLAEIMWRELEDVATAARGSLATALDRSKADPDERELLDACALGTLREDYCPLQSEVARTRGAYFTAVQQRNARVAVAVTSQATLTERRNAKGLPPPASIPEFVNEDTFPAELSQAEGAVPPAPNAGRLEWLRGEENKFRAAAELERIARDQQIAEAVEAKQWKGQRDEAQRVKDRAAQAAEVAANAADRAETARLADAHRARSAP